MCSLVEQAVTVRDIILCCKSPIVATDKITLKNLWCPNLLSLTHFQMIAQHIKIVHHPCVKMCGCAYVCVLGLPVIVSIAQCPDRNGERLPHRVECILYYFSLMADSEPVERHTYTQAHAHTPKPNNDQ